jgi:N-acetylglucosamine-6-sulfatase
MRYPKIIPAGSRIEPFALSIDIAPTVLELAGPQAAGRRDGRSLTPLFASTPRNWRNDFLIEYYSDTVFPRILKMGYRAVRNQRWKYIQFQDLEGCDELYDLESDQFEMTNLIRAPQAHGMLARMRGRLHGWRARSFAAAPDGVSSRNTAVRALARPEGLSLSEVSDEQRSGTAQVPDKDGCVGRGHW